MGFIKFKFKTTYLVCLAHTEPMNTLKELWDLHKRKSSTMMHQQLLFTASDLARIICIVIQGEF